MKEESEKDARGGATVRHSDVADPYPVVFGNVRDEILAISNNEEFDVIVVGSRKPGTLHPSAGLQRRVDSALRQNAGAGRPLIPSMSTAASATPGSRLTINLR